jgi:hypothetical protein
VRRSCKASAVGMPARGVPQVGEYDARDDADAAEQQGGAKHHLARGQNEQNCCHHREQRGGDEAVTDRPWAVPLPQDADEQFSSQQASKPAAAPAERPAPLDRAYTSAQRSPPQPESTSQSCGEFPATDVHAAACGEVWQPRHPANRDSGAGWTALDIPPDRHARSSVLWSRMDALSPTTDQKARCAWSGPTRREQCPGVVEMHGMTRGTK